MFHISVIQAIATGLIQGITELFPVSSLGHSVLIPAWFGGSYGSMALQPQYLLVAVALHLASACALFLVFAPRWFRILSSVVRWRRQESGFQVFVLLILGSIPVAIIGKVFSNFFEKNFSKPLSAAIFLAVNGFILLGAERLTSLRRQRPASRDENETIAQRVSPGQALVIGVGQSAALFAGISRFGITVSFGMLRGLSRSVAADFAFLLSFPVILGASLFKLPKLSHGALAGNYGAIGIGVIVAFAATLVSVLFLVKWFKTRTLYPFAIYCLVFGLASVVKFA